MADRELTLRLKVRREGERVFFEAADDVTGLGRAVQEAGGKAGESDREFKKLIDRLEPARAATDQLEGEQRLLKKALDDGKLSAERYEAALSTLEAEQFAAAGGAESLHGASETASVSLDKVAKAAAAAALAAGALVAAAAGKIIQVGAEFEILGARLETVEGSSDGAARAMDYIVQTAAATPNSIQEVTEAYTQLRTFGLDPTTGSLQAVLDASARAGGGQEQLHGIVLALGQAYTKQKLQGEEIMQLQERMIPVWDILAAKTGLNVAQLQDLSQKGQLGRDAIDLLIEGIGEMAQGAAAHQMDTFTGKWSNLTDLITTSMNDLASGGLLDAAKDGVSALMDEIERMKDSGQIDAAAQALGRMAADLVEKLPGILSSLESMVGLIADLTPLAVGLGEALAVAWGVEKIGAFMAFLEAAPPLFAGATAGAAGLSAAMGPLAVVMGAAVAAGEGLAYLFDQSDKLDGYGEAMNRSIDATKALSRAIAATHGTAAAFFQDTGLDASFLPTLEVMINQWERFGTMPRPAILEALGGREGFVAIVKEWHNQMAGGDGLVALTDDEAAKLIAMSKGLEEAGGAAHNLGNEAKKSKAEINALMKEALDGADAAAESMRAFGDHLTWEAVDDIATWSEEFGRSSDDVVSRVESWADVTQLSGDDMERYLAGSLGNMLGLTRQTTTGMEGEFGGLVTSAEGFGLDLERSLLSHPFAPDRIKQTFTAIWTTFTGTYDESAPELLGLAEGIKHLLQMSIVDGLIEGFRGADWEEILSIFEGNTDALVDSLRNSISIGLRDGNVFQNLSDWAFEFLSNAEDNPWLAAGTGVFQTYAAYQQRDILGGILGGAQTGAGLGSMLGSTIWGAVIGAVVGGLAAAFGPGAESPETFLSYTRLGGQLLQTRGHQGYSDEMQATWLQNLNAAYDTIFAQNRDLLEQLVSATGDLSLFDRLGDMPGFDTSGWADMGADALMRVLTDSILPDAVQQMFDAAFRGGLEQLGVSSETFDVLSQQLADLPGASRMDAFQTFVGAIVSSAELIDNLDWGRIQTLAGQSPWEAMFGAGGGDWAGSAIGDVLDQVAVLGAGWGDLNLIQQADQLQQMVDLGDAAFGNIVQWLQQIDSMSEGLTRSIEQQIFGLQLGGMSETQQRDALLAAFQDAMANVAAATEPGDIAYYTQQAQQYIQQLAQLLGPDQLNQLMGFQGPQTWREWLVEQLGNLDLTQIDAAAGFTGTLEQAATDIQSAIDIWRQSLIDAAEFLDGTYGGGIGGGGGGDGYNPNEPGGGPWLGPEDAGDFRDAMGGAAIQAQALGAALSALRREMQSNGGLVNVTVNVAGASSSDTKSLGDSVTNAVLRQLQIMGVIPGGSF